jgi:hypothetical protein
VDTGDAASSKAGARFAEPPFGEGPDQEFPDTEANCDDAEAFSAPKTFDGQDGCSPYTEPISENELEFDCN